jgi:protein O-mannosyl-transferase
MFVAFFAVTYGLHFLGFGSPMVYDSSAWIEQKAYVFASRDLLQVISIVPVRPLFMSSLYLNYVLTGMDPYFFRLLNAVLLAGTGVVLALLLITILEIPTLQTPLSASGKRVLAVFLATLYVVHPLQSFVVLYIWQREAILACLFYFSALATYLGVRSGRFSNTLKGYGLTATLFLGGLISKENLLTLPLVMGLAEVILFQQTGKQILKRALLIGALLMPPLMAYLAITYMLHGAESQHAHGVLNRLAGHYAYSGLSPLDVVLTECRVLFSYLHIIIAPDFDGLQFSRVETISRSLFDPPITLFACAGVMTLMGTAAALYRKRPLVSFGCLFLVISLMPESLLIPQYLYFGYRAVLPMAGILMILADLIPLVMAWLGAVMNLRVLKLAIALAALCAIVYPSAITLSQAKKWTPLNFWKGASDTLPPFSAKLEVVPYLDIAVNSMLEHINVGQYREAVDIFRRAAGVFTPTPGSSGVSTDEASGSIAFQELAERMLLNFQDKPERTSAVLLNLGVALASTGDWEGAVSQYKKSIELNSGLATTYLNLGAALEALGNPIDAMHQYARAIDEDPRLMPAYNSLADALTKYGFLAEALEVRRIVAGLEPSSAPALRALALAFQQSGNLPEAVETYRKSLEIEPCHSPTHINLGRAFVELGDLPAAVRELTKAVETDPASVAAQLNLGYALQESGNLAEASRAYENAIRIDPECVGAYNNLALILRKAGKATEALRNSLKAADIAPQLPLVHNNLGLALEETGKHLEALSAFRRALEIDPYQAETYSNIGSVLMKSGRLREALERYNRAIEIDPYGVTPYVASGKILEELGDRGQAIIYYRNAVELSHDSMAVNDQSHLEYEQAKQRLKILEESNAQ